MPTFTRKPAPPVVTTRPLGWQDVEGGTTLRTLLEDYRGSIDGSWAARGWIDGDPCFLRGGGKAGPRSIAHPGSPGAYAITMEGDTVEVLVKTTVQREDGLPELEFRPVLHGVAESSPEHAIPITREDWEASEEHWPFS